MKGIITKDLLGLKQVGLTMGLLMLFYIFLGFISMKDSGGGISYFSIMALVINVMVPLSCAGYDEQCDWDSFGASLPVSKNKIVVCRYIVGLMVICFTTLVVLIANLIMAALGGTAAGVAGYIVPILVSVYYIALMTPISYKFGVQKSRFIVIAVMIVRRRGIACVFRRDRFAGGCTGCSRDDRRDGHSGGGLRPVDARQHQDLQQERAVRFLWQNDNAIHAAGLFGTCCADGVVLVIYWLNIEFALGFGAGLPSKISSS